MFFWLIVSCVLLSAAAMRRNNTPRAASSPFVCRVCRPTSRCASATSSRHHRLPPFRSATFGPRPPPRAPAGRTLASWVRTTRSWSSCRTALPPAASNRGDALSCFWCQRFLTPFLSCELARYSRTDNSPHKHLGNTHTCARVEKGTSPLVHIEWVNIPAVPCQSRRRLPLPHLEPRDRAPASPQ